MGASSGLLEHIPGQELWSKVSLLKHPLKSITQPFGCHGHRRRAAVSSRSLISWYPELVLVPP